MSNPDFPLPPVSPTEGWQVLFVRLLDGESLNDAETQILVLALAQPENLARARQWLVQQSALRQLGESARGFDRILSREKLLAGAALQEHALSHAGREKKRRAARAIGVGVMVALMVSVVLALRLRDPGALVRGDVQVLRAGHPLALDTPLQRGDRLVAGAHGARVELGRCCVLRMAAGTDMVWTGAPGAEAATLAAGGLTADITPNQGGFLIKTSVGTVQVLGTRFTTTLYRRMIHKDDRVDVKDVLEVAVEHGRVRVRGGGIDRLLNDGESVTVGDDDGRKHTKAKVLQASLGTAVIASELDSFTVQPSTAQASFDLSLLKVGDPVVVSWIERDGERLITDIGGSTVGTIARVETNAIILLPERGGPERRFGAHWSGGKDGHPHTETVALIARQRAGQRVRVSWNLAEGLRLLDVAPVP